MKRLSVKQLWKRLGQEQFDLKNIPVAIDVDGGRVFVTGAELDKDNRMVVLSTDAPTTSLTGPAGEDV